MTEPELALCVLPSLSFKYFQGDISPLGKSFIHLLASDSMLGTKTSVVGKAWRLPRKCCSKAPSRHRRGESEATRAGVATLSQQEVTKDWLSPLYLVFCALNEMSTFIHKYLLCACYVPGVVLGARDTAMNKKDKNLPL